MGDSHAKIINIIDSSETLILVVEENDEESLYLIHDLISKYGLKVDQSQEEVDYYEEEDDAINTKIVNKLTINKKETNQLDQLNTHKQWQNFQSELAQVSPLYRKMLDEQSEGSSAQLEDNIEFSGLNWTRIWFSKNPNICITPDNKDNIENFLRTYQDYNLTLIYDSHLLNDKGKLHLQQTISDLNQQYGNRITFNDFRSQEFQNKLRNNTERKLYNLASAELDNIHNGGNVAAASDIVRTLGPSYQAGIYTDFDVEFTNLVLDKFSASSPLLYSMDESMDGLHLCNDIMAIHPDAANHQCGALLAYQQRILDNYHNFDSKLACQEFIESQFKNSKHFEILMSKFKIIYDKLDSCTSPLFQLRHAFEYGYVTSPNSELSLLCRQALMNTVITTTGPKSLTDNRIHSYIYNRGIMQNTIIESTGSKVLPTHNNDYPNTLGDVVKGQTSSVNNHASWIPKKSGITSQSKTKMTSTGTLERILKTQKNMKSVFEELREAVDEKKLIP